MKYEEKILQALLDSYERSSLSRGENTVAVHISFPITKKTMPIYFDENSLAYEEIHPLDRRADLKPVSFHSGHCTDFTVSDVVWCG